MISLLAADHKLRLFTDQDALSVIFSGLDGCIFTPEDLHPDFFELANQLAGNVFQKFVNYRYSVAIVIEDITAYGTRVEELIQDHTSHPYIRFFTTIAAAENWIKETRHQG